MRLATIRMPACHRPLDSHGIQPVGPDLYLLRRRTRCIKLDCKWHFGQNILADLNDEFLLGGNGPINGDAGAKANIPTVVTDPDETPAVQFGQPAVAGI